VTARPGQSLDPLIGRDAELRRLLDALERERLVTLTGPGGSGKTRLAEAAVDALAARGPAWFVDCSALEDADLLGATLAAALGLEGALTGDPVEILARVLGGRRAWLVLDNLEQLRGAGDAIVHVLQGLPELSILTTSRRPLQIRGEHEVQVPPLGLPAEDTLEALEASPAGQLFLRRTGASGHGGRLDDEVAAEIAGMLRRLDGIPLGIELAAARARVLSPAEINRRLDERGPAAIDFAHRDGHRSLRSIMDWTVGQLDASEGELLEALTVCAGFDVALAEALLPDIDVVPALEALVGLGLVQHAGSVAGASRFRMLIPIQEMVDRRLDDAARRRHRDRHAAHFVDAAGAWERRAAAGETAAVTAIFDVEADNVRRALDHLEQVDARAGLALITVLSRFWHGRGRFRDGYARFLRAKEATERPTAELVWAGLTLVEAGWLGMLHGEVVALEDWALEAARDIGDVALLEEALSMRAQTARPVADVGRLRAIEAELATLPSGTGAASRIRRLNALTRIAGGLEGDTSDRALALQQELLQARIDAGDNQATGEAVDLAGTHFLRGEYAETLRLARGALATFVELGREEHAAWAMVWLAAALAESGKPAEAVEAERTLLRLAIRLRTRENISNTIWAAMPVAFAIGQPELAARCYGVLIRGMHARGDVVVMRADLDKAEEWLERAKRAAPSVAIELALQDGARTDPIVFLESLTEVFESASQAGAPHAAAGGARIGDSRPDGLTRREVEILRLVGLGRSDHDIAEELFISRKTASVHVSNIKAKLGLASRLEVALRARDMGLVGSAGD
jgi:predicted ATPase/DNA-binding CsgD family transcriptional regulator